MGQNVGRTLALYRKYRSRTLGDIIGQKHVTDVLQAAVNNHSVSHAYLFTGPRGVGKTSAARVLAYAVNNLTFEGEANHLDIIEIDAASNRGIDEVRDLRDKVHLAPTSAPFKVYIIDEVHMMTGQAFNALLKTLEEPPAHVIFILATTEIHKVPSTIVSRTQRFAFRLIPDSLLIEHLQSIAQKEHIAVEPGAFSIIAQQAQGSMRDCLSLFDQVRYQQPITEDYVRQIVGRLPQEIATSVIDALLQPSSAPALPLLELLTNANHEASAVAAQLIHELRQNLSKFNDRARILLIMEDLASVSSSSDPMLKLEISLLKHLSQSPTVTHNADTVAVTKSLSSESISTPPDDNYTPQPSNPVSSTSIKPNTIISAWDDILGYIKKHNNSLYSVLRMARPSAGNSELIMTFNFSFHKHRVDDKKNTSLIQQAIREVTHLTIPIKTLVSANDPQKTSKYSDPFTSVISVMGGGTPVEIVDE